MRRRPAVAPDAWSGVDISTVTGTGDLAAPSSVGGFVPRTFDSFRDREFRWFYIAMLGQMASMNMQMVVRGFLAFVLTGSYAVLGLVALVSAAPMLVLSVFGGVAADRLPKKTVLQIGQLLSLVNAAVLALLVFLDLMLIEWLILSAFAQGIVMALTMPSRQAMVPDLVGLGRMMNAVSLNMAGMNTMRLFAPAAGGLIIGFAGFGWAFLTMAGLYGVALIALSRVTWQPAVAPGDDDVGIVESGWSSLRDIRDGVRYISGDRLMLSLLGLICVSAVFAWPYLFLLPGYVADIFGGGGSEIGLLVGVSAVGSLAAALVLAARPNRRRGLTLLGGMMVLAIGLFAFAQTASYWMAAGFLVVVGIGSGLHQALSQGLLHSYVDNAYRGRVMAVFMMQVSVMQFATFFVGLIAEFVGIRVAIAGLGAGLALVTVCAFLFVPRLRRLD